MVCPRHHRTARHSHCSRLHEEILRIHLPFEKGGIRDRKEHWPEGNFVRKVEKPSDFSVKETSHEELLAENARTKSSMAKELYQMGFSKDSIERILHLKMTVEEIHENKKGG